MVVTWFFVDFFGTVFFGEEVGACVTGRGGWFGVLQDEVGMG